MPPNSAALTRIARAIARHQTFFIAGHVKPDGDTVGSGLALAALLKRRGKKPFLYSKEAIPPYLSFLPGVHAIHHTDSIQRIFDCAIILESASFERMGNVITPAQATTIINIDHHAIAGDFGDINYVDPHASSSAEQIYYLFKHLRMKMTPEEAEGLYVGLVTDTGKFQQSNTTPDALRMAADLLEAGVEPTRIYDRLYASSTMTSLQLLAATLSTLKLTAEGKIAYMEITNQMYQSTGSHVAETEGIINFASTIPTVQIALLFRETDEPDTIKVSMRSRGDFDVNKIARHFNGGGHRKAAGCTLYGTIDAAERTFLAYVEEHCGLKACR